MCIRVNSAPTLGNGVAAAGDAESGQDQAKVREDTVMSMSEATRSQPIGAHIYCTLCGSPKEPSSEVCVSCDLGQRIRDGPESPDETAGLGRSVIDWLNGAGDMMDGQKILVIARWILVVSGLLLALWNPDALGELKVEIGLILALAVANFFLHVQMLKQQSPRHWVAYLASAVDVVVITAIIVASGGAASGLYVFYFPALFAITVVFRLGASLGLAGGAIGVYGLIVASDIGGDDGAALVARVIMMAAVVTCGMVYRNIERERRREAGDTL